MGGVTITTGVVHGTRPPGIPEAIIIMETVARIVIPPQDMEAAIIIMAVSGVIRHRGMEAGGIIIVAEKNIEYRSDTLFSP